MSYSSKKECEVRRAQPLLGTFVEIFAGGLEVAALQTAITEAFQAMEEVHGLMSFHEPASALSHLNRMARKRSMRVHPLLFEVLRTAKEIAVKTGGLFDCSIAPVLMRWKYIPRTQGAGEKYMGTCADLELKEPDTVAFRQPMCLDLGGIAKGFAVDRAVQILKNAGVPFGGVNAGGDLRIFGDKEYPLHVRSPKNPRRLVAVGHFRNVAVATSAPYFSRKKFCGRIVSALVHPHLRKPFVASKSVSVFAPSCMIADALAKAVLFSKSPQPGFLQAFGARAMVLT